MRPFSRVNASGIAVAFERLLQSVFSALLIPMIGLALGLVYVAQACFWADSEIWAVSSSARLFTSPQDFAFEMKPFFYLLLYFSDLLSQFFNSYYMMIARGLFTLNALVVVALTYFLSTRLTGRKFYGFFAAGCLLTSVEFAQQAYRIRSDFLATSAILSLLLVLVPKGRKNSLLEDVGRARALSYRDIFIAASLAMTALASTPNAVVLLLAYLPFFLGNVLSAGRRWFEDLRLSPRHRLIIAFVAAIIVGGGFPWLDGLMNSFDFFFQTFTARATGWPYWSLVRFEHLIWFSFKDVPFASMILLSVFLSVWKIQSRSDTLQRFMSSTAFLALLLFFHPSKLPFLIASYLPFFAVTVSLCLSDCNSRWRVQERPVARVLIKLFLLGVFVWQGQCAFLADWKIVQAHNNSEQIAVMDYLGDYLKQFKNPSYYDVIGILQDFPPTSLFIGPGQIQGNQRAAEGLQKTRFDFIFFVQKLNMIAEPIAGFISKNYIDAGQGVYVRGFDLEKSAMHLDDGLSLASGEFLQMIRTAFGLAPDDKMIVCLRAENGQKSEITSTVRFIPENGPAATLNQAPDALLSQRGRLIFPQDFARIRVSPFGCPQLPTQKSIQELFRFDPEI